MTTATMRYELPPPPERNAEPPQPDSKLEEALRQYRLFCADISKRDEVWTDERIYFHARDRITAVLNQLELNLFLAKITLGRESSYDKSVALTTLIKNVYETGINSFDITIPEDLEPCDFGAYLCGTKELPYNLRINGNLGSRSFFESKHVNATVKGTYGDQDATRAKSVNLEFERLLFDELIHSHGSSYVIGYEAEESVFRFHHIEHPIYNKLRPRSSFLEGASKCTIQLYTPHDFENRYHLYVQPSKGHKIQLLEEGTNKVLGESKC